MIHILGNIYVHSFKRGVQNVVFIFTKCDKPVIGYHWYAMLTEGSGLVISQICINIAEKWLDSCYSRL